jgi:membrane associated rhomboid family serine protease
MGMAGSIYSLPMLPLRDVLKGRTTPWLTMLLVAVNVVVFLAQVSLPEPSRRALLFEHGFMPQHMSLLSAVTAMFLHGGVGHLAVNMLYLWIFGDNVEDRMGHGRFLAFYLLCGLAATAAQAVTQPASALPMVGASGAISGVLGAYLLLFPQSRVLTLVPPLFQMVELPAVLLLGIWFLVQVVSGIAALGVDLSGGMALGAHAGGFLAGMATVHIFKRPERMAVDWWDKA